jgi:hypothetical protein
MIRKALLTAFVLSAGIIVGCDNKTETKKPAPAPTAAPTTKNAGTTQPAIPVAPKIGTTLPTSLPVNK